VREFSISLRLLLLLFLDESVSGRGISPGSSQSSADRQAARQTGPKEIDHGVSVSMERVKGIEPSSSAWEAAALPLSYTREGSGI
jgi:hypothetical protein